MGIYSFVAAENPSIEEVYFNGKFNPRGGGVFFDGKYHFVDYSSYYSNYFYEYNVADRTPTGNNGQYAYGFRAVATDLTYNPADGMLLVEKATLTATADDCRRTVGADNPEFTISYSGFRNGDTADDAINTAPIVTTDADRLSPEGTYVLTVSGGEARNYHFVYVSGTLTVEGESDGIDTVTMPARDGMEGQSVYTLDGRLVKMPRAKGIYISEGKKIVVR